jgi:hypothetical protein
VLFSVLLKNDLELGLILRVLRRLTLELHHSRNVALHPRSQCLGNGHHRIKAPGTNINGKIFWQKSTLTQQIRFDNSVITTNNITNLLVASVISETETVQNGLKSHADVYCTFARSNYGL